MIHINIAGISGIVFIGNRVVAAAAKVNISSCVDQVSQFARLGNEVCLTFVPFT